MQLSELQQILKNLQTSLNNVTVASIVTNNTLQDLFLICDGDADDITISTAVHNNAEALRCMVDTLDEFATSLEHLEDFISD